MHFLTVLEAEILRWGCPQGWVFLRSGLSFRRVDGRLLPVPSRALPLSVYTPTSSGHWSCWIRPTHVTSLYRNHLFKGPISKNSDNLRYWVLRLQRGFWGNMIQPVRTRLNDLSVVSYTTVNDRARSSWPDLLNHCPSAFLGNLG